MRHSKTAHILTTEAADGLGCVQLVCNATGRILAHQGYCHAAEWNWNHQLIVKQAEYLGYRVTGEQRRLSPPSSVVDEATGDENYQLALAMDPGDHDYQLGLGI